jgi:hypothetical protein
MNKNFKQIRNTLVYGWSLSRIEENPWLFI